MTEPARQESGDTAPSAEPYLERIGLSRAEVEPPTEASLARLQRAHVTSVPFDTFSINGDPHSERSGAGICLSLGALYDKVVTRRRGGFCFELNGLFGWLLAELGFEVTRLAGRMVNAIELPANHHPLLVGGQGPSLVDVGMGPPMLREPLGLGDSASPDKAGVRWRIDESDRPDAEWILRYRPPDEDWQDRYVFDTMPRSLEYFAATCEYLQSAPESGFTGSPVVTMSTPDGHKKLKPEQFSVTAGSETTETAVTADTFHALLRDEFGIVFPADSTVAL